LRGEKILSPPWFQHCGGERPRRPRRSDASDRHQLYRIYRIYSLACTAENWSQQVGVQLPTSPVNAALLASAAECRAAAPLLLSAGRAAIDRYLLSIGRSAANPRRATDGIDKQMDEQTETRPLHRPFVDPAKHTTHAGGVKNSILIPDQSTVAAISLHYRGHVGLVTYLWHKNNRIAS